jgi:lysozyme family protein
MLSEQALDNLLEQEGGYGNNPKDAGGATNKGVTQAEYNLFRFKKGQAHQSVKHISMDEVKELYQTGYWDAVKCDSFDHGVANALFDAAVNSGPKKAVIWLQEALNNISGYKLAIDGVCGPYTQTATEDCHNPSALINGMLDLRLAFMHVARNNKTGALLWPTFGHGWKNRIDAVRAQSLAMIKKQTI